MTRVMTTSKLLLGALALAGAAYAASVGSIQAQQGKLKVDWQDNEIKAYVQEQKKGSAARSLGAAQAGELSKVKLPVLAFDAAPAMVTRSLGAQAAAVLDRSIVVEDDQESYTITDRFGANKDITITVSATLKVAHKFPADHPYYENQARGAAPSNQPTISIEESEIGGEGVYADYTVTKFPNIPYNVRIECSGASKDECRDIAAIALDAKSLKIISAREPGK